MSTMCLDSLEVFMIVDKKLQKTDINVIKLIMSFLIEECENCENETIYKQNILDSYHPCCNLDSALCLDCQKKYFCQNCDEELCINCMEYNECYECDKRYCYDCEYISFCNDCEDFFCKECKSFYLIQVEDCTTVLCENCVNNCKM